MGKPKECNYEKHEVVWAKIRGYPCWPAEVQKIYDIK